MLTLIAIPAFLLELGAMNAPFSLAISGLLWMFSPFLADHCGPVGNWFFNPFAWQFLFVIGMFFGVKWDCPQPPLHRLRRLPCLLSAAWAIVALALAYKLLLFLSPWFGLDPAWLRIAPVQSMEMKKHLSILRLCHFLAVAFLVATYFHEGNALLRTRLAAPIIWAGMNSLQIFSLTIVLSAIGNVDVMTIHPNVLWRLSMDALAFTIMGLVAYAMLPATPTKYRLTSPRSTK